MKPIVELELEAAITVFELRDQLSYFQDLKTTHAWTAVFRASAGKWKQADGEIIAQALLEAGGTPHSASG